MAQAWVLENGTAHSRDFSLTLCSHVRYCTGSGIFDWEMLDEAPTVTSFTLDPTEVEEREKEIGRLEGTILEGTGRRQLCYPGGTALCQV